MAKKTRVYLIGAGPGSQQLISIRALQIVKQADCILYDRLIAKELLSFARSDAELVYVGKDHSKHPIDQQQINRLLVEKASVHKTIARLKGGDAMIFGRATEEIKCLIENDIDFEIVPGITAASAAAACAGIVLTDRDTASAVTFITGHGAKDKEIDVDFESLAKLNGTIVFYMAVANMKQICRKLVDSGLASDINAIVVANASMENQKIVEGAVSDIAEKCTVEKIEPPALMIIGKNCQSYLKNQPLFGKRVLMTRDVTGNAAFAYKLAARAACPISCPAFELQDLTDTREVKDIINKIGDFDWVFFTSPTGVRVFFHALAGFSKDARAFASAKIACIGSETANALGEFGIIADFLPAEFTSKTLADSFIKEQAPAGKKILLLRSALADLTLAEKLQAAKAEVAQVSTYTAERLKSSFSGNVDWITFASSFAVRCFFENIDPKEIKKIKIASIGPATSDTLKNFGIMPTVEAQEHTIDGLIEIMEKFG
ncbi:MAG: uroporphyrinogen-III C-methyltransferase [Sedimentisphaerales bacterium]|nr:uroporphyrinogen-III C-methyltransferase [Sedimentisphaerales bacterium]